jgi:hypothetical protein
MARSRRLERRARAPHGARQGAKRGENVRTGARKRHCGFRATPQRLPFDFLQLGLVEFPVGDLRRTDFDDLAQPLGVRVELAMPEESENPVSKLSFRHIVVNETVIPIAVAPFKEARIECVKGGS